MLVRGIQVIGRVAAMASRPTAETAVPLNGTRLVRAVIFTAQ